MNIINCLNTEDLQGYKKKSFALPYNGGEIWFEHLDGMYDNENLVLKKLQTDIPMFTKPSTTSYICFVFDETTITDNIIIAVADLILLSTKCFRKIAFSGVNRKNTRKFKHLLCNKGFCIDFFEGLEDAKEWLLS